MNTPKEARKGLLFSKETLYREMEPCFMAKCEKSMKKPGKAMCNWLKYQDVLDLFLGIMVQ